MEDMSGFWDTQGHCIHHGESHDLGIWDGSKFRKQQNIRQHDDSGNECSHGLPVLPGKNVRNSIRKLICPHMVKENLMSNKLGRFKGLNYSP